MKRLLLNTVGLAVLTFFISGCASVPVVQPTSQALEAVKKFKKTVAIIGFSDKGSPIKGMQAVALPKLEKYLMGHFNLVERRKIKSVIAERRFNDFDNVERMNELGKLLGADYLAFGNVIASVSNPAVKEQSHEYESGKFYGRVWEESYAVSNVALKFIDVNSGMVVYADTQKSRRVIRSGEEIYRDKPLFDKAFLNRRAVNGIIEIIGAFKSLHKEYASAVSQAVENSIRKFNKDLNYKFPQTGQIIKIVSGKDVVVNLGSAYGIKPGDKLIVWKGESSFKDPKTGLVTVSKEKKAILKVTKVTSGLACIAKGSARVISSIKIGDIVYTYK